MTIEADGRRIFTIMPSDVNELNGETPASVAATVVERLGVALTEVTELSRPRQILFSAAEALLATAVFVALTWFLLRVRRGVGRRFHEMTERRLRDSVVGHAQFVQGDADHGLPAAPGRRADVHRRSLSRVRLAHLFAAALPLYAPLGRIAARFPDRPVLARRRRDAGRAARTLYGPADRRAHAIRDPDHAAALSVHRTGADHDPVALSRDLAADAEADDRGAVAVRGRDRLPVRARQRIRGVQGHERVRRPGGLARLERHREPGDERVHAHLFAGAARRRFRDGRRRRGHRLAGRHAFDEDQDD